MENESEVSDERLDAWLDDPLHAYIPTWYQLGVLTRIRELKKQNLRLKHELDILTHPEGN